MKMNRSLGPLQLNHSSDGHTRCYKITYSVQFICNKLKIFHLGFELKMMAIKQIFILARGLRCIFMLPVVSSCKSMNDSCESVNFHEQVSQK